MDRLGLDRKTQEELAQWAAQIGATPGALGQEIVRLALPSLKAAVAAEGASVSNVVAITSRAGPWLGTRKINGR